MSACEVKGPVSHLTQSQIAAIERTPAAARAGATDVPTKELFIREIPEGQPLEGYHMASIRTRDPSDAIQTRPVPRSSDYC